MPRSPRAVDAAMIAILAGDPALTALLPDGVYFDTAHPGSLRYVWIDPLDHDPVPGLPPTPILYERYTYLVRAVTTATDGDAADAAGDRIDALLHDQPLSAAGYSWMSTLRLRRVRDADVDPIDTGNLRFQQRGGVYEVCVSPD